MASTNVEKLHFLKRALADSNLDLEYRKDLLDEFGYHDINVVLSFYNACNDLFYKYYFARYYLNLNYYELVFTFLDDPNKELFCKFKFFKDLWSHSDIPEVVQFCRIRDNVIPIDNEFISKVGFKILNLFVTRRSRL